MLEAMPGACGTHMPHALHERTNELTNADLASTSDETGSVGNARGFHAKVDISAGPDACWPWTGSRNRWGYGRVRTQGVEMNASRAAYIAAHGPLDRDTHVLHSCDNPPCCNPAHLRPGSHADNMADRLQRGRYRRGAQVSPAIAAQIRAEYSRRTNGSGTPALARRFGVSRSVVQRIVTGTEAQAAYPAEVRTA